MDDTTKSGCFSHKDLLYSEILNTSVKNHVRDLFEKKEKSCTFPIPKSTVLARASKFLKSVDNVDENVQNIEDVEDGEPVIDMSVTLIQRTDDSEIDSELDLKDEDSDDETEDDESITSSDSDSEAPEDEKLICGLRDKLVHEIFVADSEHSQNGSRDVLLKNDCTLNTSKSKYPESKEQESTLLNQKLFSSTDSEGEQSDTSVNSENLSISTNFSKEQFKSDSKDVTKVKKLAMSPVKSNQLSEQENETQNVNFLEFSKPVLLNDNVSDSSCKQESSIQSLDDLKFRKRKLIAVIEDDDSSNLCLTKTQKVA